MKKLKLKSAFVITVLFILSSDSFSQINVYKPFPPVYGKWIVQETKSAAPSCPPGSYINWKKYEAMGDTIVGAYTYKKVYVANNTGYPSGPPNNTIPFGPNIFDFAYRNDTPNKKVYYLDCTGGINKDTLWFDFNLNIGDTLKETYSYSDIDFNTTNYDRRIVSSIDSIQICGTYYKRFNFNCPAFETYLIEGQGFGDRFFDTNFDGLCPFEPCITYDTEFFSCYNTSIKSNGLTAFNISIFPNPVSHQLNISSDKKVEQVLIYDLMGKQILRREKEKNIDVSLLKSGIYFIKIKTDQGEFSQKFVKE